MKAKNISEGLEYKKEDVRSSPSLMKSDAIDLRANHFLVEPTHHKKTPEFVERNTNRLMDRNLQCLRDDLDMKSVLQLDTDEYIHREIPSVDARRMRKKLNKRFESISVKKSGQIGCGEGKNYQNLHSSSSQNCSIEHERENLKHELSANNNQARYLHEFE